MKGTWAYLKRTGDFSGELSFERMGKSGHVEAANYEDLATKIVGLLRHRKWNEIRGGGKAACLDCTQVEEGCIKVFKIEGFPLICYKCKQECTEGVFVV